MSRCFKEGGINDLKSPHAVRGRGRGNSSQGGGRQSNVKEKKDFLTWVRAAAYTPETSSRRSPAERRGETVTEERGLKSNYLGLTRF